MTVDHIHINILKMELDENALLSSNDESFYLNESPPKDPLGRYLEEISRSYRPFTELIRGIKERMENDLKHLKIDETDLSNFDLDTMYVLLSLRKDFSVEDFLKTSYVGCFDAMLCLKTVAITPLDKEVSSMAKRLIGHIQNALSVIWNVSKEKHWSIPDLRSERTSFNETVLEHLMELTDVYLKTLKKDYPKLRRYENLIKNFRLVEEIDRALDWLRDEFEELRHNLHGIHRENELSLQAENMEALTTFADED